MAPSGRSARGRQVSTGEHGGFATSGCAAGGPAGNRGASAAVELRRPLLPAGPDPLLEVLGGERDRLRQRLPLQARLEVTVPLPQRQRRESARDRRSGGNAPSGQPWSSIQTIDSDVGGAYIPADIGNSMDSILQPDF